MAAATRLPMLEDRGHLYGDAVIQAIKVPVWTGTRGEVDRLVIVLLVVDGDSGLLVEVILRTDGPAGAFELPTAAVCQAVVDVVTEVNLPVSARDVPATLDIPAIRLPQSAVGDGTSRTQPTPPPPPRVRPA